MRSSLRLGLLLTFFTLAGALQGCALGLVKSLHDVSYLEQAPVPVGAKSREITSEVSRYVFLGFIYNTRFVDSGWNKFKAQCPNGTLINPFVRYSTDLGFLAYTEKLYFSGTCVEGISVD